MITSLPYISYPLFSVIRKKGAFCEQVYLPIEAKNTSSTNVGFYNDTNLKSPFYEQFSSSSRGENSCIANWWYFLKKCNNESEIGCDGAFKKDIHSFPSKFRVSFWSASWITNVTIWRYFSWFAVWIDTVFGQQVWSQ